MGSLSCDAVVDEMVSGVPLGGHVWLCEETGVGAGQMWGVVADDRYIYQHSSRRSLARTTQSLR
jgi:hypothetical protein